MGECILQFGGGGLNTKDLSPQVKNLTLVGGDAKIDAAFTGVTAEYLPLVKYYRVIAKAGGVPTSPTDGTRVDVPVGTSGGVTLRCTLTGLQNDVQHGVRVYVRSTNGWQTSPDAKGFCTPRSFSPVLADNSWAQIAAASEAGIAQNFWKVGDEKTIVLTTGEALTLQIYGFKHDDLQSGGKAGITFGMKNLMAETRQMNSSNTNYGGFTGTTTYSWLQSTLLNSLPADLRSVLKITNKNTSAGSASPTINTNAMRVFLFSEIECYGAATYSFAGEGMKYPIFTDSTSRIKKQSNGVGSANDWWIRSPYATNANGFCIVNSGGYPTNGVVHLCGVCFGFCV